MTRIVSALLVIALSGCGGQTASTDGPTATRVVGSEGDPSDPDAGDASGFVLDAAFADAPPDANPFADAAACASRPVATCTPCDSGTCAAPMVGLLEQMLVACGWNETMCATNVAVHFDATGCAAGMFVTNGNAALDACVASKLAAERFPLAECNASATEAHTMNGCGPK